MSTVPSYLSRLRERYPLPRWLEGNSRFGPNSLPTPLTVDALIAGSVLRECRIMFDPLARPRSGDHVPVRGQSLDVIGRLADQGFLTEITRRVQRLTTAADRTGYLTARDERLLLCPPWEDGFKFNIDTVRVADLILVGAPALLTGPLGSGKSTFCRWLVNGLARARLNDSKHPLPLFLDLRSAAPMLNVTAEKDGIVGTNELCRTILSSLDLDDRYASDLEKEWLQSRACLLVDGLDEISVVMSQKAAGRVEAVVAGSLRILAQSNPRILVASRPGLALLDEFSEFLEVEFAPLTLEESMTLLSEAANLDTAESAKIQTLALAIPEQLRSRPLFLSLVGRLIRENSLPVELTRWSLLEASLHEILSVRIVDKDRLATIVEALGCGYNSIISSLQEAACEALTSSPLDGAALSLETGRLMALLYEQDPDTHVSRVLEVLTREAGLLVKRGTELEFSHRIFQDFLTAGHLADERHGDRAHRPLIRAIRSAPHATRDAAELYVERLSSTGAINDLLDMCNAALEEAADIPRSPHGGICVWLAGIGLREVVGSGHALSRRDVVVVDEFLDASGDYIGDITALNARDRALIAEQVGEWGDRRDGVGLNRGSLPDHAWVKVRGGRSSVGLRDEELEGLERQGIPASGRELPAADVVIDAISISLYPTTWTQFRAFLRAQDGYTEDRWWLGWEDLPPDCGSPTRLATLISSKALGNTPVVGVDWFEAIGYCRWLSAHTERIVDLPTEEEWEVACRGSQGSLYPWGDSFEESMLNWAGSGLRRVVPVGCFVTSGGVDLPRPWDMIGNVWEWTKSIAGVAGVEGFAPIGSAEALVSPPSAVRRVVRGGCYLNEVPLLRATYRGNDVASARYDRQGFRVVVRARGRGLVR
jgi:formylglycine-generating enzyme required for sulfatase activity